MYQTLFGGVIFIAPVFCGLCRDLEDRVLKALF
jgi:hypothetical protein